MQTSVFPLCGFLHTFPNLLLIIIFSYGYIYGSMTGIVCGLFAGVLMDLFYPVPFGLFILIFSYLGFFSGLFSSQLKNDTLIFPIVLCIANELIYNFAILCYRFFTIGHVYLFYSIENVVLPELFITALITMLVYRLLLHTNRTLDRMDDIRGQNVA